MRGSGTSQAAAVVLGVAALVLQQHPTWTNNQVKALLVNTASKLKVGLQTDAAQGKGTLNLTSALWGDQCGRRPSGHQLHRRWQPGRGPGSAHLVDNGVVLNGEKDIFGDAIEYRDAGLQAHRGDGLDRRHLERPHVVGVQLHRQQLDRHHLVRAHVVRAHVVQ